MLRLNFFECFLLSYDFVLSKINLATKLVGVLVRHHVLTHCRIICVACVWSHHVKNLLK